jgi:hypothetical protein
MLRNVVGIVVVLCLCGLLAAPAGARPRSHNVSLTFTAAALPPGSANSAAGEIKGSLGPGAILIQGGSTGTVTVYYGRGRIDAKINATVTNNPDGSQADSGQVRATGGTGTFARARGTLSLTGTTTGMGSLNGQVSGTLIYGR